MLAGHTLCTAANLLLFWDNSATKAINKQSAQQFHIPLWKITKPTPCHSTYCALDCKSTLKHNTGLFASKLHFTTLRYRHSDLWLVVWTSRNVLNLPQHQQTINNATWNLTDNSHANFVSSKNHYVCISLIHDFHG